MPEQPSPNKPRIFTIGHSNHDEQTFVELLKQHRIDVVADVRSQPYSKYATHFNTDQIKLTLAGNDVRYVFLGQHLGGRASGAEFYDAEGYVLYDRVAASEPFLQGIERLEKGIREYRVAILCSEENPAECHRNLLVGRVLAGRGVEPWHIRGDGRLQSQADVDRESCTGDPRQQLLFEELKERPWRSTRSVLPEPQQPNSSES
jgi:uncharacterized protein (DUF488 family)